MGDRQPVAGRSPSVAVFRPIQQRQRLLEAPRRLAGAAKPLVQQRDPVLDDGKLSRVPVSRVMHLRSPEGGDGLGSVIVTTPVLQYDSDLQLALGRLRRPPMLLEGRSSTPEQLQPFVAPAER